VDFLGGNLGRAKIRKKGQSSLSMQQPSNRGKSENAGGREQLYAVSVQEKGGGGWGVEKGNELGLT